MNSNNFEDIAKNKISSDIDIQLLMGDPLVQLRPMPELKKSK